LGGGGDFALGANVACGGGVEGEGHFEGVQASDVEHIWGGGGQNRRDYTLRLGRKRGGGVPMQDNRMVAPVSRAALQREQRWGFSYSLSASHRMYVLTTH
jgi:hypothetical protein